MPHEIRRILEMAATGCWFIEPGKAQQILAVLELRASGGALETDNRPPRPEVAADVRSRGNKVVRVLRLMGTILPRADMLDALSGGASLTAFQKAFREAATDPNVSAIVIEIDSPGGQVDLVPETAALIRAHKQADRPIVAVANTIAMSAAYWIASAADELVVTPSGSVGSIGVYMMHQDISEALAAAGIKRTFIYEGPRKVEGNPFAPLDDTARQAMQDDVRGYYHMFTDDVAKARGVPVARVRADPEDTDKHFGGGRYYHAKRAVQLGMADRVATLDDTIARLARGNRRAQAANLRRRMSLI